MSLSFVVRRSCAQAAHRQYHEYSFAESFGRARIGRREQGVGGEEANRPTVNFGWPTAPSRPAGNAFEPHFYCPTYLYGI